MTRSAPDARGIVAAMDGFFDDGVLREAVEEAVLRGAVLQVVISRGTGPNEAGAAATESDRRAFADLDRRLAHWRRRHPRLRVESVAVPDLLDHLAHHRRSVDLVVAGAHNRRQVAELVGPVGSSVLQGTHCSLLIVNRQHL